MRPHPPARLRRRRGSRGVVLLDVVLAVAVLSLAALVLMPGPRAGVSTTDLRAEAARIAATFRQGRAAAIQNHGSADVLVDPAARTVALDGETATRVRDGIGLDWVTSNLCPMVRGTRALRFLSDGRSCGGVLTLTAAPGRMQLRVDWLTGRVEMSAL